MENAVLLTNTNLARRSGSATGPAGTMSGISIVNNTYAGISTITADGIGAAAPGFLGDDAASSILIDLNGDGTVDAADIDLADAATITAIIAEALKLNLSYVAGDGNADFDLDGDVDGADFLKWQAAYPAAAGTGSAGNGDADFDGDVDGADFLKWQAAYPQAANWFHGGSVVPAAPAPAPVPEPATMSLLALGGLALIRRRK